MLAQGISEGPEDNVVPDGKYKVLRTAAVYGANSSGKSNLVSAMRAMQWTILSSVRLNPSEKLRTYDPFLLNKSGRNEPTFFEVVFSTMGGVYRYGFTYDASSIVEEWLFQVLKTKEQFLFVRNSDGVGVNEDVFEEGIDKEKQTNPNRLFLSLCAQLGGKISSEVLGWFVNGLVVISGLNDWQYGDDTLDLFYRQDALVKPLMEFYDKLNLGFRDLVPRKEKSRFIQGPDVSSREELYSVHNVYGKKGEVVGEERFYFQSRESNGTKKLFNLSGVLFLALQEGKTLVVDELDSVMHPLISQQLVMLFNSKEKNPNRSQLIFNTHDTHLLSARILRRDQIWFTEKNSCEVTDLYNMMDIVLPDGTKPRSDANYEKNYIAGRYGAIPYILNE